ncbi:MAG: hypothetical protein F6J95_023330 [Leptolyngbya sp. SIO1E4]|nr:hypothetical protein [Leptolyngbya sp. SIO1E4]
MKRVLVITNDIQRQNSLPFSLKFDKTVHVTAIDVRQISTKRLSQSLRSLRRTDLIIFEKSLNDSGRPTSDGLLSSLQATGIPIMVLSPNTREAESTEEPLVLNWSEQNAAQSGLKGLLREIWVQHTRVNTEEPDNDLAASPVIAASENSVNELELPPQTTDHNSLHQQARQSDNYSKVTNALISIRRISNQLREPLSNMNLAIHMLGQVQSAAERERYLKLLREEYNRELQLLNQLDNLQANLPPVIGSTNGKR